MSMARASRIALAASLSLEMACSHRAPTPVRALEAAPAQKLETTTATSTTTTEVSVGALPKGHLPGPPEPMISPGRSEHVAGILYDGRTNPPRLSGVRDAEEAVAIDLRDQEGAETSFCLAPSGHSERLASFAMPIPEPELGFRAERIDRGTGGRTKLNAISAWATRSGALHKTSESAIDLMPIAEMSGVEVFAFLEEPPSAEKRGLVHVIVRRPPLRRGQAQFASFVVTPPEGAYLSTSCTHTRVALPLERGNGATASIDVAVEGELGARGMRVNVSTLWLRSEQEARVSTRMRWVRRESWHLLLTDRAPSL
jgi:hypothetical protein